MLHAARILLAERQRAQRLGEQRALGNAHGDLPRARLHQTSLDAQVIPQIEQLDETVPVCTQLITLEVKLDLARRILEVRKRRLAVGPQRDEAPRDPVHRGIVVRLVGGHGLLGGRGAFEPVGKRRHAALQQLLELFAPGGFDETGHYAALLPKRFRKASMKGSRSPSITLWTSLTFSSVR